MMETVTRHATRDTDHRVPIIAYRDALEFELGQVLDADPGGPLTLPDGEELEEAGHYWDRVLSVLVWRREDDPDSYIVEWLLACGGPTVQITYDSRWTTGTLLHSWGMHDLTGEDRHEIDIRGEICERLADLFGVSS